MDEEKNDFEKGKNYFIKKEVEYPRRNKRHCNHKQRITRNYILDVNVLKSLQS